MQNYSVEDARKTTARIEGWLTDSEGRFLYNTAKTVKKGGGGVIVEIGSWKGKSTVWLGSGSKAGSRAEVYAIDPHKTQFQTSRFSGSSEEFYAADDQHNEKTNRGGVSRSLYDFKKNIKTAGVADIIITIAKTSEEACRKWKMGGKIAVLFIDGAHDYQSVEKDFLLWSPHLVDGGTIAFHDTLAEGPRRVVEKYVFNSNQFKNAGFVDSIVFATKVKRNSFSDRLRNNYVLYLKDSYEFLTGLALPAWLRSFGKKIFRTLQR